MVHCVADSRRSPVGKGSNMDHGTSSGDRIALNRHLTPLGAWALAFGCSVGWGAFVMPGTTFLPVAGPWGTIIGIILGVVIMFLIGSSYHY